MNSVSIYIYTRIYTIHTYLYIYIRTSYVNIYTIYTYMYICTTNITDMIDHEILWWIPSIVNNNKNANRIAFQLGPFKNP